MDRVLELGSRKFTVNNSRIIIGEDFILVPGEVSIATGLLGMAGSMANLRALPPEIKDEPFEVQFEPDGNHKLVRSANDTSVEFTFEGVDELIQHLNMALDVSIDIQKINPPVAVPQLGEPHGDIFEGRN